MKAARFMFRLFVARKRSTVVIYPQYVSLSSCRFLRSILVLIPVPVIPKRLIPEIFELFLVV